MNKNLLGDFQLIAPPATKRHKEVRPLTIWIPAEVKAKYDFLQNKSGRRLSKKAREVIIELIGLAEAQLIGD